VAHVLATGETDGYYADYAKQPASLFARALAEGFAFQGEESAFRDGAARGEPSSSLPPTAFVNFLQNHDQIGNRALGERITQLADPQALRALYACILLAPATPLLFMGEEFAASSPFLFFCNFDGELARAVTEGRRAEFGRFARFADPSAREQIPDPNADSTFERSKLDWSERQRSPHREWLDFIRHLLALRAQHLVPHLPHARSGRYEVHAPRLVSVQWTLGDAGQLYLTANLDGAPVAATPAFSGTVIYQSETARDSLPPWFVRVALEPRHE
jgi:maltooligosyltrehalose trehalohydrolase